MRLSTLALGALLALPILPATAEEEGLRLPMVEHAATLKECSSCHMIYPPQLLPQRSWAALMGDLANHFGENAELDAKVRDDIASYLASKAADAADTAGGKRFLRRLSSEVTPLRITEMPYWIRAHGEISDKRFSDPKIKSKANCMACHKTADKGEFFEED